MPFAAPSYTSQKRPRPQQDAGQAGVQSQTATNSSVQRLRAKAAKGHLSAIEQQMLNMLQRQTAAEVKTAIAAKASFRAAGAEDSSQPLTHAQARARFLCRAQQAEVTKAKARTQYIPQGPGIVDEEGPQATSYQTKQQHAQAADNDWQFWNSYFQKMPTTAAREAMAYRQRQQQHARWAAQQSVDGDDNDSEDEDDLSDVSGYGDYLSDDLLGTDSEDDMNYNCEPPRYTATAATGESAAEQAYKQLLLFVQRLPACITNNPAAAALKALPQVPGDQQPLARAARQIWLAIHPDKNCAKGTVEASQQFSALLKPMKENSLL